MKRRILAIALLAVMLVSSSATALAITPRASAYINTYNLMLTDRGNGVVRVSAVISATRSNMTQVGFPTIVLYENVNGTWKAVKTVNSQYTYDAGSHGYQFDYQGVVGRQYQAYCSVMAKNDNGGDSREVDSNNLTLK